jgi:prefoldin subunit 5
MSAPAPEVERQALNARAEWLQAELEAIKKRLEELASSKEEE